MEKISLDMFASDLTVSGSRITWLIGSGFSYSAGMPLANGISERMILFDYIVKTKDTKGLPWEMGEKVKLSYRMECLERFFNGYSKNEDKAETKAHYEKALSWIKDRYSDLKNLEPKGPEFYQALFLIILRNERDRNAFIKALVGKVDIINPAHLGLAGILKKFPERTHTVFTTNFDDLLLKALLSLNQPASIYGELNSKDTPRMKPDYPQIVHLHGRHTGYRLLNTKSDLTRTDIRIEKSFKKHVEDSSLIVLGYSGWDDDVVMRTLKELKDQPYEWEGNIYWVPYIYKNKDSQVVKAINPNVKKLLASLPKGKVFIVHNDDQELNADSFILKFCEAFNKDHGGFRPFREQIKSFAAAQHDKILDQLDHHPEFHPNKALKLAEEAREALENSDMKEVNKKIEAARYKMKANDIKPELRAKVYQETGIIYLLRKDFDKAENDLLEALKNWKKLPFNDIDALRNIAIVQRGLAELMLFKNDWYKARHILKDTIRLYTKEKYNFKENNVEYTKGLALTYLLYAILSSRQGKHFEVNWKLKEVEQYLKEEGQEDKETAAIYKLLKAYIHFFQGDTKSALQELEEVKKEFKQLDKPALLATAEYYLLSILIRANKLNKAKSILDELIVQFEKFGDKVNLANCLNSYGEYYFRAGKAFYDNRRNELNTQEEYYAKAEDYFLQAKTLFQEIGATFGFLTCLADLFYLYEKTKDKEKRFGIVKEIFSLKNNSSNPYFKKRPLILEYDQGPLKVSNSPYMKSKN